MPSKKTNQIVVKQPGVIGGLKWYWWVLIGIIGFFILSSLISTLVTGRNGGGSPFGNPLSNLSKAILGLAEGLLNLVVKSPFTYFMIAIWAFPFLGAGASAMYKAYSSKQQDKTKEEIRKEAGVDKENLEDVMKELREKNQGIKTEELVKAATNTTNKRVQDKLREVLQREVNEGRMTAEKANEIMKESAEKTKIEETDSDVEGQEKAEKNPDPIEKA
jgi:predicted RNase H-related nuclease YkuK (DUF458 family)